MSQTEISDILALSSCSHITPGDDVTPRKRPPKLSDTKLRPARISFPEVTDNLGSIVESLRQKWSLLARQFSSRDPTVDSSFPRELSVDTSDALVSDFSSEDLSHEQEPSSQALEFRGCAREILDELEALISATNPVALFPLEEEVDTSQGAELAEEGLQSLIEFYCQQQVSAAGYALECVASCTVDAAITKSVAFLVLEGYRAQDQCHLRSIIHTIDTTFPKGRVESGELSDQLTSSMVETHVKGRLSYFQKKVDKMHANNSILDWIKGTQAPEQRSLISWMATVPSSSEDETDPLPVSASRIRSAPRGMCELSEPQSLSGIFAPRRSISDITFSFSRPSASDAGLLMQCEPVLFNRKLSDSSQLSSSYPSNAAELLAGNPEFSHRTDKEQSKPKVLQEFVQECFYSSERNDDVTEEARISVAIGESEPIGDSNVLEKEPTDIFESNALEIETEPTEDTISAQTSEGFKMRQIKGKGILLRQYSCNQLYDDSNIESSIPKQMIQGQPKPERPHTLPTMPAENQLTPVAQEEELSPQSPQSPVSPGENRPEASKRRGSRGLLKPSRSFEESSRSHGKCVEFSDSAEYAMPPVQEMESADPDEQAFLQAGHKSIMESPGSQPKQVPRKPLLSSFSFNVGDGIPELGTESVAMATPAQRYKTAPDPEGEQFERFEQDWRAFQVSFEADVFSSRHRLRQSNINLNRKLERMHEYASALDECISILSRSTSPDTFRDLEETFRTNLTALSSSLQDVVATAQAVGHLSQELKDNSNFRLCFSYVDKLKYRPGTRDPVRADFRMSLPRQESTVSNSSEPALISEDMVQIAIERFITQPAQERQWPSFRKERSQFTAQQSQVAKELKLVVKNYDSVIEKSKDELNWVKFSIKLMLLVLILILLLYLTSDTVELSLYALLRNLRLR